MTRPSTPSRARCVRRSRTVLALAATAAIAGALAGAGLASADGPLITSGPTGPTNDATPEFAWTAPGKATCTVDGRISFIGCTSPFGTGELEDGPHVVEIEVGEQVEARSFVVDTVAPLVEAGGDEGTMTEPTATITFEAEPGTETTCAVDDAEDVPCTSPWTTPALSNRTHVVHVRATDAAGNVGATDRVVRMEVVAPDTTIVAGPIDNEITAERRPAFTFTASRPAAKFRCAIDDGAAVDCGPTWAPADDLTTGLHTVRVAAVDAAGNVDPTPAERRFTVAICQQSFTLGAVNLAAECLRDAGGGKLEANGPIKVNGLTFNPKGKPGYATVVIDTATRVIQIRDVQMRMGSIVLFQGDLEFTVPAEETFTLATINTDTKSKYGEAPEGGDSEAALDLTGDDDAQAAGLPIRGTAKLELSKGTAILTASIELPKVFTDAEGNGLTGQIKVTSSNEQGFKLAGARVTAPLAFLGKVEVQNLAVSFVGDGDGKVSETCNLPSGGLRWEGSASVIVFPAPGKPQLTDVGFGLADGKFAHAEATLKPSGDGAELGAGVKVTKLGVSICAGPPVRLEGRAGITALPDSRSGKPRLVIPDAGLIYTGATEKRPWTIRAEAPEAKIAAGDVPITFNDLYLQVAGNGAVDFGGGVKFTIPLKGTAGPASLDASVAVEATAKGFVEGSRYSAELTAKGCFSGSVEIGPVPKINFTDVCPQIEGVVSSTGFAVCGALTVKDKSIGRVGAGKNWDGDLKFMGSSCDVGPWKVARELPAPEEIPPVVDEPGATTPDAEGTAARASRLAAATVRGRRFAIGEGSRNVLIALRGAGSVPPRVTLVGPHGQRVPTPASPDETARTDRSVAFTNRALATTYVGLRAPQAGTWTAIPAAGDEGAVRSIEVAPMLAPVQVRGTIAGHGRHRTVRVQASTRRGQRITLIERGTGVAHRLGTIGGARGRVAFRAADGPAGTRTVEALVEQNGVPRERITVASFTAPGPPAPARPAALRIRRVGSTVRIDWTRAARAARYGLRVETSDGRVQFLIRGSRDRTAIAYGIPRSQDVSVRVVGLLADNTPGRARATHLAARAGSASIGSRR
jgi:hypothetical protein